jgi:hypothetical protein
MNVTDCNYPWQLERHGSPQVERCRSENTTGFNYTVMSLARSATSHATQPFLTWSPRPPKASMGRFQGVRELGWEKITTLFSLASNWNPAFQSMLNVGNQVIYGQTPKMFVKFNKSVWNYYTLRKENQNTFSFPLNCPFKKRKFNFNLPIFLMDLLSLLI